MNKFLGKFPFVALFAIMLTSVFTSCGGDDVPVIQATSLSFGKTSMEIDSKVTMDVITTPTGASVPALTWTSSDNTVATVVNGVVTPLTTGTTVITATMASDASQSISCNVTVVPDRAYVDLGLPSGTLWATCNVGADSPEDYGDYFAWGETSEESLLRVNSYSWATYRWCSGTSTTLTGYCTSSKYGTVDNRRVLASTADAASSNWGVNWKMPTRAQMVELYDYKYTKTEWTQLNGVYGMQITSISNGSSIFLPAAGNYHCSDYNGTDEDCKLTLSGCGSTGNYWTSEASSIPNLAWRLCISSGTIEADYYNGRYLGYSVRPVRSSAN